MKKVLIRVCALLAVVLVGVACGAELMQPGASRITITETPSMTPKSITPRTTVPERSAMPPGRGWCGVGYEETDSGCKPCVQLKPCFNSPYEMRALVGVLTPDIWSYSESVYGDPMPPAQWNVMPYGTMQLTACGPMASMQALGFCPGDSVIHVGDEMLWKLYSSGSRGDAVVYVVLAHEYAHHVQKEMGIMPQQPTEAESVKLENQADCFSGAAAKYANEMGVFSSSDLEGVEQFIPENANYEDRTHGTPEERLEAFRTGYDDGLTSCNAIGGADITPN